MRSRRPRRAVGEPGRNRAAPGRSRPPRRQPAAQPRRSGRRVLGAGLGRRHHSRLARRRRTPHGGALRHHPLSARNRARPGRPRRPAVRRRRRRDRPAAAAHPPPGRRHPHPVQPHRVPRRQQAQRRGRDRDFLVSTRQDARARDHRAGRRPDREGHAGSPCGDRIASGGHRRRPGHARPGHHAPELRRTERAPDRLQLLGGRRSGLPCLGPGPAARADQTSRGDPPLPARVLVLLRERGPERGHREQAAGALPQPPAPPRQPAQQLLRRGAPERRQLPRARRRQRVRRPAHRPARGELPVHDPGPQHRRPDRRRARVVEGVPAKRRRAVRRHRARQLLGRRRADDLLR